MRFVARLAVAGALAASTVAQAAETDLVMYHQGRLVRQDDSPVSEQVTIKVRLWDRPTGGSEKWADEWALTPQNGAYSIALGDTDGNHDALTAADITGDRWLSVTIGTTEMLPRIKLSAVPRALVAEKALDADKLGGTAASDYALKSDLAGLSEYAKAADVYAKTETLSKTEVNDAIAGATAALSDYAKTADVYSKTESDGRYLQKNGAGGLDGALTLGGAITATGATVNGDLTITGNINAPNFELTPRLLAPGIASAAPQEFNAFRMNPSLTQAALRPTFSTSGAWDSRGVISPVAYRLSNGTYRMFYAAHRQGLSWHAIGLATSTDGVNWTRSGSEPVFKLGSWDGNTSRKDFASHNLQTLIATDDNNLQLYYGAHDNAGVWRIFLITSTNGGQSWTLANNGQPVLDRGPSGSFDASHVWSPGVLKDGNKYKMWYVGHDGSDWNNVGYVESNDGVIWGSRTLVATKNELGFRQNDYSIVGFSVVKLGSLYYAFYALFDPDTGTGADIVHAGRRMVRVAVSRDGLTWTPRTGYVLMPQAGFSTQSWDNRDISYGSASLERDGVHLWYSSYRLTNFKANCTDTDYARGDCIWSAGHAVIPFK